MSSICHYEEVSMQTERVVRLFKNGRNQAVRIPRELELPGQEAILRKEGRRLVLEPVARKSLLSVLARLRPLDETLPEIKRPAPEPVDI
jgi:antitoxin VapB